MNPVNPVNPVNSAPARSLAATDVLKTYRYLRLAMVLLVGMLAAAVLWQTLRTDPHCIQNSISAYYYTPARAVFIAVLAAVGTCLIVYHSNIPTEDVLLNFTGVASLVVAFVPTPVEMTCKASDVPSPQELAAEVSNNCWALLLVGLVATVLTLIMGRQAFRTRFAGGATRIWLAITTAVVLAGVVTFLADRQWFVRYGHAVAAVSLFAGIVLVVVMNAVSFGRTNAQPTSARVRNRYGVVAGVMVATLILAVVAHLSRPGFVTWRFWLEAAVIVEFGTYWVLQTVELWNLTGRADPAVAGHELPRLQGAPG